MTAPRKPILTEDAIRDESEEFTVLPASTDSFRQGFRLGAEFALAAAAKVAEEREAMWREWMRHLAKISNPSDVNCEKCDRFRAALGIDKEGA